MNILKSNLVEHRVGFVLVSKLGICHSWDFSVPLIKEGSCCNVSTDKDAAGLTTAPPETNPVKNFRVNLRFAKNSKRSVANAINILQACIYKSVKTGLFLKQV